MKSEVLGRQSERRTLTVRFADGEDLRSGLLELVHEFRLHAGRLTALGSLSNLQLQELEAATATFRKVFVGGDVRVIRMLGEVAAHAGTPMLTVHLIVADATGVKTSGYLLEAKVAGHLDVVVLES